LLAVLFTATSCEDVNVRETEQYFKQVYIVGASDVVWTFDVSFSSEPQPAYISIATGGTQNIDEDVEVKLRHNDAILNWYNNKYGYNLPALYRRLEADHYSIPTMSAVIKAGEVYAHLPFTVTTDGLHCDSLYSITFEIESVSKYEKNEDDSVLIMNLNLINGYSGVYQLDAAKFLLTYNSVTKVYDESPSGSLSTTRTLKAVDENSVRFFNEAKAETRNGYVNNEEYFSAIENLCLKFVKNADDTFTVEPWRMLEIIGGECTYSGSGFDFWYDYTDASDSKRYRIRGTLTK
jgi:hypothetical protein